MILAWWQLVIIALLVIFQPEIRSLGYRLSHPRAMRFLRRLPRTEIADEIVDAVDRLSRAGQGGILVLEQQMSLDTYVDTGTELDASISSDLLVTIFAPYTPLHDGAVIVRDGVILGAGCILPLSQAMFVDRTLGTRHRAAVGLSEVTDAMVIVVSEENTVISVAYKGELFRSLSTLELRDILNGQMPRHPTVPTAESLRE